MAERVEIAGALRELALLLGLKGENRFKARAYDRAADALERFPSELDDFDTLVRNKRLTEIPGVGASIASVIDEVARTGSAKQLDALRAEIPRGIIELSKIDGLTDQRIQRLVNELGVDSLEKLESALSVGRVKLLKGFGEKTEQKIRDALARYHEGRGRLPVLEAWEVAERLKARVAIDPAVREVEIAGELRRYHDSTALIEVVAATTDANATVVKFTEQPEVVRVESRTAENAIVRLTNGLRAQLFAVSPERFALHLIERTGSEKHVEKLKHRAHEQGLQGATENEIYQRLGLEFIPPELREDLGEIEAAEKKGAFDELLSLEDLKGAVHCHTKYSDGRNTVEEMAKAADALGLEYMTITDHSPSAFYAHGVELARLKDQWAEIENVQNKVNVRLLRGTESDILANGELDYPLETLQKMEIVIASIHSRFQMDSDAMTARVIHAMQQPVFKIWGHPLGRLILKRDPVAIRMEEVLAEISRQSAAVEISGDPNRFELQPEYIRAARALGIRFVVSVDAHSTRALGYAKLGVHLARRGGVKKSEVLNTLPLGEFQDAVRPARSLTAR